MAKSDKRSWSEKLTAAFAERRQPTKETADLHETVFKILAFRGSGLDFRKLAMIGAEFFDALVRERNRKVAVNDEQQGPQA